MCACGIPCGFFGNIKLDISLCGMNHFRHIFHVKWKRKRRENISPNKILVYECFPIITNTGCITYEVLGIFIQSGTPCTVIYGLHPNNKTKKQIIFPSKELNLNYIFVSASSCCPSCVCLYIHTHKHGSTVTIHTSKYNQIDKTFLTALTKIHCIIIFL